MKRLISFAAKQIIKGRSDQPGAFGAAGHDVEILHGLAGGAFHQIVERAGDAVVINDHGRLYNPETGYLVGSWATLRECVQWLRAQPLLSETEIEQVAHHHPLRLIDA